jgi:hypothetical protein
MLVSGPATRRAVRGDPSRPPPPADEPSAHCPAPHRRPPRCSGGPGAQPRAPGAPGRRRSRCRAGGCASPRRCGARRRRGRGRAVERGRRRARRRAAAPQRGAGRAPRGGLGWAGWGRRAVRSRVMRGPAPDARPPRRCPPLPPPWQGGNGTNGTGKKPAKPAGPTGPFTNTNRCGRRGACLQRGAGPRRARAGHAPPGCLPPRPPLRLNDARQLPAAATVAARARPAQGLRPTPPPPTFPPHPPDRFKVRPEAVALFEAEWRKREEAMRDFAGFQGFSLTRDGDNFVASSTWATIPEWEAWSLSPVCRRSHLPLVGGGGAARAGAGAQGPAGAAAGAGGAKAGARTCRWVAKQAPADARSSATPAIPQGVWQYVPAKGEVGGRPSKGPRRLGQLRWLVPPPVGLSALTPPPLHPPAASPSNPSHLPPVCPSPAAGLPRGLCVPD